MAQLTVKNLWSKLTTPHPSITDVEQRRQSQLLASLLIAVMATFALIVLSALRQGDMSGAAIISSNIGILCVEFILNRRGKYKPAAYLFVGLAFLFVHLLAMSSIGTLGRMYYIAL